MVKLRVTISVVPLLCSSWAGMVRQCRGVCIVMFLVRVHIGVILAVVSSDYAEANTENKEEDWAGSHVGGGCHWCSDDQLSHMDSFIGNFIRKVKMNANAYSLLTADSWKSWKETGEVFETEHQSLMNVWRSHWIVVPKLLNTKKVLHFPPLNSH